MKILVVAALAGLLAACTSVGTSPSESTLPTTSTMPTTSAAALPSPSEAAMSCSDAFAAVDLSAVTNRTDLTTLGDQLDQTIASCASISEWTAALNEAAPNASVTSALAFLQSRCADSTELANTSICGLVGS